MVSVYHHSTSPPGLLFFLLLPDLIDWLGQLGVLARGNRRAREECGDGQQMYNKGRLNSYQINVKWMCVFFTRWRGIHSRIDFDLGWKNHRRAVTENRKFHRSDALIYVRLVAFSFVSNFDKLRLKKMFSPCSSSGPRVIILFQVVRD